MVETVDDVRERARASYLEQLATMDWLKAPDKAADMTEMERVFTGFLPHFDAWIHDARLRGVPAGRVRAVGAMALSNMLDVLVRNTTPDKAARPGAVRLLAKLMVENLKTGH